MYHGRVECSEAARLYRLGNLVDFKTFYCQTFTSDKFHCCTKHYTGLRRSISLRVLRTRFLWRLHMIKEIQRKASILNRFPIVWLRKAHYAVP